MNDLFCSIIPTIPMKRWRSSAGMPGWSKAISSSDHGAGEEAWCQMDERRDVPGYERSFPVGDPYGLNHDRDRDACLWGCDCEEVPRGR